MPDTPEQVGWMPIDELIDAWAFNVALECSGTQPDEGRICLGGAFLSIHDLNTILQSVRAMAEAVQNASAYLDTPIARRRHAADPFYTDVIASIRAALPPSGD